MSAQRNAAADVDRLRHDVIEARQPSADLFHRVAKRCVALVRPGVVPEELSDALAKSAYVEAAHILLTLAHPDAGYMMGKLPTGSAHVRLMVERGNRIQPIDSLREDGQLALAILDVLMSAELSYYTR